MQADNNNTHRERRAPRIRAWFLIITALLAAAGYLYYAYDRDQRASINAHNLRSLQEVATEFNNRLEQLVSMHTYRESRAAIQSVFLSYREQEPPTASGDVTPPPDPPARYVLGANRLAIDAAGRHFTVDVEDLLPAPDNGFLLYAIADRDNRVLSSSGGAAGLSLIDTQVISRAIHIRDNQDWLKLAASRSTDAAAADRHLPGYSTQIDVKLHNGSYSAFVLPFTLNPAVSVAPHGGTPHADAPLYLVGIQPQELGRERGGRRWYLSLLIVSLVALVAVWTVVRLEMLSPYEPIGTLFHATTLLAAYLSFLLLTAALLAFAQREVASADRERELTRFMATIDRTTRDDLATVIHALRPYHDFYSRLLDCDSGSGNTGGDAGGRPAAAPELGGAATVVDGAGATPRIIAAGTRDLVDFLCSDSGIKAPVDAPQLPRFSKVNVYPPGIRHSRDADAVTGGYTYWFDIPGVAALPDRGRLQTVFLMNRDGRQVLPMFYFIEFNSAPKSYGLAHRDYFRRVRDRQGWRISAGDDSETPLARNIYIQRLLNINNGNRGSTLGMPLQPRPAAGGDPPREDGYFLGADIVLPSLSLTGWPATRALQDTVLMVVDRESGAVLYHVDASRSMVENLYRAGRGSAAITQRIRSGRLPGTAVRGYYHGDSGAFVAADLPVDQWALVAFLPDASLDSLTTNAFLVNAAGMSGCLLLLYLGVSLLLSRRCSDDLKRDWCIPDSLNRHVLLWFCSLLLASVYAGFRIGGGLAGYTGMPQPGYAATASALAAAVIVLAWGFFLGRRLARDDLYGTAPSRRRSRLGLRPALVFPAFAVAVTGYLWLLGDKPGSAIAWYQQELFAARLNREKREIEGIALTRYPNTIKLHDGDPLAFVPIDEDWRRRLAAPCSATLVPGQTRRKQPYVMPDDIGTFSRYTSTTTTYQWVERYLLNLQQDPAPRACDGGDSAGADANRAAAGAGQPPALPGDRIALTRFVAAITLAFLLLCWLWRQLHRRVLNARMLGTPGLLEHLRRLSRRDPQELACAPRPGLFVDLRPAPRSGQPLAVLLRRRALTSQSDTATRAAALLRRACPWLESAVDDPDFLAGVRVSVDGERQPGALREVDAPADAPLCLSLTGIDDAMGDSASRAALARTIRQLAGQVGSGLVELRVYMHFHSYESVLLQAHDIAVGHDPVTAREFRDWAAALADFAVELPEDLTADIDPALVAFECAGSRLLEALPGGLTGAHPGTIAPWRQRRRWHLLRDVGKSSRDWATLHCLMLQAGALYRSKWDACSSAEKLALYQLARKRRVNTANAQLLEQLALQGLIRIADGRIWIVNNSFAYFARHAENTSTFKQLVELGEVGTWQQYRLPVTLAILLALGGIAIVSGSSLYMIAASLIGLLGTIGSLTSSANIIRENLR